uniref:Uncharacterized protein n=1 Tax=viral metagenome TaxID=1070528 RepID=A0A6C0CC75_9ZZZZ
MTALIYSARYYGGCIDKIFLKRTILVCRKEICVGNMQMLCV